MKMNPFLSALAAAAYIVAIVFFMQSMQAFSKLEETIFIPMFMLSLFVFSAATMAFLFFYQPFRLYADGHKNEAVVYFLKTLGSFAGFVVLFFAVFIISIAR